MSFGSLRTTPQAISSVGMTVDGREVTEQIIDDIVETFNPDRYGARINIDHNGDWSGWAAETLQGIKLNGGMLGDVVSVSKEKNQAGVWCLHAVLAPNHSLLQLNQADQYVYYSIEIDVIDETGKYYLTGLAMTDKPACTWTTRARFNKNTEVERFKLNIEQQNTSMFANIFKKFQKEQAMDIKEVELVVEQKLQAFSQQITEKLNHLSTQFSTHQKNIDDEEPSEPVTKEHLSDLTGSIGELQQNYSALEEKITQALKQPKPGTEFGEIDSPGGDEMTGIL